MCVGDLERESDSVGLRGMETWDVIWTTSDCKHVHWLLDALLMAIEHGSSTVLEKSL